MKIYINTENQLPVFASTLPTITEENGVLRVYEQGSSGTVSGLVFKRGTTVEIEFVLIGTGLDASQINDLTFGIKLKGKYDDFLVIEAAAESYEETSEGVSCKVTAVFDSQVIDNALAVNGDSSDDIESADFIGAVSWKGSDGQVTETATLDVEIRNNVIRAGDGVAGDGLPSGVQWTALMVVRMSWADYQALCEAGEDREDVLYVCPDAPDKETELEDSISTLEDRVTVNESDISTLETNYDALEQRVDNIEVGGEVDLSEYAKLSGADFTGTVTVKGSEVATMDNVVDLTSEQTIEGRKYFSNGYGIEVRGVFGYGGTNLSIMSEDGNVDVCGSDKLTLRGRNTVSIYNEGSQGAVSIDAGLGGIALTTTATATYNGEEIATKADIKNVDLTGYAKLDAEQTWTAAQRFVSGVSIDTNEAPFVLGILGDEGTRRLVFDGTTLRITNLITATYHGSELATVTDLADYAKLDGADFTGTLSVNGSEVALKSDIKDVDLTGYAKEDWVKEYHSADIEELKEWVKEELQKTEAGAQAAAIEELQQQVKDLEDAVYTAIITINVPEGEDTFVLADLMEGSSASSNYTGGAIPQYDFSVTWGDGTASESYTNENWEACSHSYSKAGTYTIKIQGTFEYIGHKGYADSDASLAASQFITEIRIA